MIPDLRACTHWNTPMLGPFLKYENNSDLERLLNCVEIAGVQVTRSFVALDSERVVEEFRFTRGFGAVTGRTLETSNVSCVYLGCSHPANPFFWIPEMRLLTLI